MSKRSRRLPRPERPSPAARSRRLDGAFVAVCLLAFAVRLAVILDTRELPLYRSPQLDSLELITWARQILLGDYVWPSPPTHGPVYPYALAGFLWLSDGSLTGARILQGLLGAVSVFVAMRLAIEWFDRRSATLAGVMLACYGPLVFIDTSFYEEGLFTFLLVTSLLLMSRAGASGLRLSFAGACLGTAAAARPTALILLPLYLFVIIRRPERTAVRVRLTALLLAASLGPVLPVVWTNWRATGVPMVRAYGGLNFFMGNRPGSDGVAEARIGGRWDRLQSEPLAHRITNPVEQDRYFFRRALDEIRRDSTGWLATVSKKILWLTQATEIRESHSFHFFRSQSAALRALPTFGVLFPLAAAGLLLAWRDRRLPVLLWGYLLLISLTCIALVIGLRYRIPLVPVLAFFAGYAVSSIAADVRSRRFRRIATAVAVAFAAAGLSHARPHTPSLNFSEEWAFTGDALLNERSPDAAIDAYRRSIHADPGRGLGWDGLGLAHLNLGRLKEAEEAFHAALSLEPGWAAAHHHLGLARVRRGDLRGAIDQFRRAARIRPDDGEIASDLADALLAGGEVEEALVVYRDIERRARPTAALYVDIGRAEGMAGRPERALNAAQRAVTLDPGAGEAWLLLSVAQRATEDFGGAESSLDRAASLLGDQDEIQLARAMLRRAQGRHTEAIEILQQVVARSPHSQQARELLQQYSRR